MERARGLFMRGCRFCNSSADLWVEYARVEMEWLAKMEKKHKGPDPVAGGDDKKGHEGSLAAHAVQDGDVIMFDNDSGDDEFGDGGAGDVILPDPLDGEQNKKAKDARKVFEEEAVKKLANSPALEGAIPKAIFDVACKQPLWSAPAGEAFFNMFAEFTTVSTQGATIQHVLNAMTEAFPTHPATCSCHIRQPLIGVYVAKVEFPRALREVLARIQTQMGTTDNKSELAAKTAAWITALLARKGLDKGLRQVLEHTRSKLEST